MTFLRGRAPSAAPGGQVLSRNNFGDLHWLAAFGALRARAGLLLAMKSVISTEAHVSSSFDFGHGRQYLTPHVVVSTHRDELLLQYRLQFGSKNLIHHNILLGKLFIWDLRGKVPIVGKQMEDCR